MTAQVTLYQSQISFEASESEDLLTAALRAGLNVDYVFNELKTGKQIAVEGPSGDFTLVDDDQPNPVYRLGTGFGPIRSLIEHCLSLELIQPIALYWVIHEDEVHYAKGYCRAVADAVDNINFTALQTDTAEEALQHIQAQAESLNGWRAYIAALSNSVKSGYKRVR